MRQSHTVRLNWPRFGPYTRCALRRLYRNVRVGGASRHEARMISMDATHAAAMARLDGLQEEVQASNEGGSNV